MHLRHLSLADFRSYETAEVTFEPGVTTLVGRNGQGKTNLVEAVGYLATLGSHRVSSDAPLVRAGAERAIVRGAVIRDGRETQLELEINPGRANRAQLGRTPVTRPRDVLGTLRSVLFAPEDLRLVKGDPSDRRGFVDDLLVARQPKWAAARSDYEKIRTQRGSLLKQIRQQRSLAATLPVWDTHLAQVGAHLTYARLRMLHDLVPFLDAAYDEVSDTPSHAKLTYQSSLHEALAERIAAGDVPSVEELEQGILDTLAERQVAEIERGVTLAGPHRDELVLTLGDLPAKGYASHGESWSFALALRLAGFELLRTDLRTDPVLVLDDVFAELDAGRRAKLAEMVRDCEQVLITAAVEGDVPEPLRGAVKRVTKGSVE